MVTNTYTILKMTIGWKTQYWRNCGKFYYFSWKWNGNSIIHHLKVMFIWLNIIVFYSNIICGLAEQLNFSTQCSLAVASVQGWVNSTLHPLLPGTHNSVFSPGGLTQISNKAPPTWDTFIQTQFSVLLNSLSHIYKYLADFLMVT